MDDSTFTQFKRFGRILTPDLRKAIIDYWLNRIGRSDTFIAAEKLEQIQDYSRIIDQLLYYPEIARLCKENDAICNDISTNLFTTFEQVDQTLTTQGPCLPEELAYLHWKAIPAPAFHAGLEDFITTIHEFESETDCNSKFFRDQFHALLPEDTKETAEKKEALRREMLDRWHGLLARKKYDSFLAEIDKARATLAKQLYAQIQQFKQMLKILGPFANECGRLWDLSLGMWRNVGFEILEEYAALLQREPELQKLAEYLGRFHQAEDELEEELVQETFIRPVQHIFHAGKSELVGVHESADINNLLPAEQCLLNDPLTELVFYEKFAEKKLLTYQFLGYEYGINVPGTTPQRGPKPNKRGPIIICVDTSGSMSGTPEHIAKVLCFAILRIAFLEQRPCYLISFSTAVETLELTDFKTSLPKLIRFLSYSFGGGTDATPALEEAVAQVQTEQFSKADILMISDFIMDSVDETTAASIETCKKTGTRFHSLVISYAGNPNALTIFDNNWVYNTSAAKPFKDVLKNVRYLKA